MSRLVSRILLSIFMFPLAGILYVAVFVIGESVLRGGYYGYRDREMLLFLAGGVFTWIGVAAYWFLLWRSTIVWTTTRTVGTLLSALGALAIGIATGAIAASSTSGGSGFGAFVGSLLTILLWLIATVFIWRETVAERARRVAGSGQSTVTCPTCGYNLTGLSESRCPECGGKFTLDELLAEQRSRIEVEIE